jgi:translation initiation factor IF-3
VIGQSGEQLGIMTTENALEMALEADMDLVEVAPNSRPPVCRIMDYGKFKYDKKKKSKRKPHVTKVKEVRFRPKTDNHDYGVKLKRAAGFLEEGHRVVISVHFRGREMAFRDRGKALLGRLVEDLAELARPEQDPRMEGRRFTLVLLPLKSPAKGKESQRLAASKKSEMEKETKPKESPAPPEPNAQGADSGPAVPPVV